MAITSTQASAAPITASFTSNDSISVGDVVTLGVDGNAYWVADPSLGVTQVSAARPAFLSSTAYSTLVSNATIATGGLGSNAANTCISISSAVLTNGNIVVAWMNSAATAVFFAIYNPNGVLQGSVTTVASSGLNTGNPGCSVAALSGGGFVVTWLSLVSANYYPSFAIYTNSGSVTTAATSTGSTYNSTPNYTPVAIALTGGGFAIVYPGSNSGLFICYGVYTATGGTTQTVTPLSVNCNSPNSQWSACALTTGGFAVAFNNASTTVYLQFFTSAGATSGARQTVVTTGSTVPFVLIASLTGGNVVVVTGNATATYGIYAYVYNTSGTLQGSGVALDTSSSAPFATYGSGSLNWAVAALSNGNAQVVWASLGTGISTFNNTTIKTAQVTSAGALVSGSKTTLLASGGNTALAIAPTADGGSLAFYSSSTTTLYATKLSAASAILGTVTTSITIGATGDIDQYVAVSSGSATAFAGAISSSSTYPNVLLTYYNGTTLARVPIGVAQNAASATQTVTVQLTGVVTARIAPVQPYVCNYNLSPTPGQAISWIGNTVILQGIYPAPTAKNHIN